MKRTTKGMNIVAGETKAKILFEIIKGPIARADLKDKLSDKITRKDIDYHIGNEKHGLIEIGIVKERKGKLYPRRDDLGALTRTVEALCRSTIYADTIDKSVNTAFLKCYMSPYGNGFIRNLRPEVPDYNPDNNTVTNLEEAENMDVSQILPIPKRLIDDEMSDPRVESDGLHEIFDGSLDTSEPGSLTEQQITYGLKLVKQETGITELNEKIAYIYCVELLEIMQLVRALEAECKKAAANINVQKWYQESIPLSRLGDISLSYVDMMEVAEDIARNQEKNSYDYNTVQKHAPFIIEIAKRISAFISNEAIGGVSVSGIPLKKIVEIAETNDKNPMAREVVKRLFCVLLEEPLLHGEYPYCVYVPDGINESFEETRGILRAAYWGCFKNRIREYQMLQLASYGSDDAVKTVGNGHNSTSWIYRKTVDGLLNLIDAEERLPLNKLKTIEDRIVSVFDDLKNEIVELK